MTLADQNPTPPAPRPEGVRFPVLPIVLLLLLVAVAAVGVTMLLRPHVEFANTLVAPVRFVVGEEAPRIVAPGGKVRVAVPRGRTVVVQWELVQPLSADGRPMGEAVRGSSVLRGPSGTTRVQSASRTGDGAYFAPLITNASTHPIRVTANAGLQGALDCGCAVRPGGRRVFVGYYRLYQNSTVQARAVGAAGSAVFRDLGGQVTAGDGSVGLRFEDKDLR